MSTCVTCLAAAHSSLLLQLLAAGARKRPLVPNLAELLEEDEEGSAAPEASEAGRRSDGAALLRAERQSVGSGLGGAGASPPHKFQRKGECSTCGMGVAKLVAGSVRYAGE